MIGFSFVKSKLLAHARKKYNDGKFKSSSRTSRIICLFSNDNKALDIAARSSMRLKKFDKALKIYLRAENNNLFLRDHNENKFKCSMQSQEYLHAFKALVESRYDGKVHSFKLEVKCPKVLQKSARSSYLRLGQLTC
mgnify:CR=1 FL=1